MSRPTKLNEVSLSGVLLRFARYHDNAEATTKALRGGWFHTGDLGKLDARGLLYITSRESDMYISGDSNANPRKVEEVLLTHPAVAEVAVLGVPDRKWGRGWRGRRGGA